VLSSAAGFAIRSLSVGPSAAPAAAASAPAQDDGEDRQRWEFAAVTRAQFLGGPRGNQYWIVYFVGDGVKTATVETGVSGNAQGKAIAMLGSAGWEMVGEGTLDTGRAAPGRDEPPRALFFKRRRS
jgi:hypothetical protein